MTAVARLLAGLARASVRRPLATVVVAGMLAVGSVAWASAHLPLLTSNLDLVDPDLAPVRRFRELARAFGTPNVLVVVLEGADGAVLDREVDRLEPRIAAVPGVRNVLGRLPLPPGLPPAGLFTPDPYLSSRDGRLRFLFVQPEDAESRAETIAPFVAAVRKATGHPGGAPPGVRIGFTGLPQYAVDDRNAVERDLARLSPVSFVLVLGLFAGAFRTIRRPLAAMAAVAVAVAVVCGLATLYPGHLTLLSAFFGTILFGLGADFGIHLVERVEREVAPPGAGSARTAEGARVVAAVEALGAPLATAALTTACAFFTLGASGFRGFAELGWIAGAGVLVSLLATVTVLPALLTLLPARRPLRRPRPDRIGTAILRLQRPWLAAGLAAAAILGPLAVRPSFDSDYLDLEPRGSEAVRWEREMVDRSPYSTQFAAFSVASRQEAESLARSLRTEETVAEVHWAGELPPVPPTPALAALAARFVSPSGEHAVYAYPRGDAWDPAVRDRFLDRMVAIDPEVTGMPVLARFMIDRSLRALRRASLLSVLVVGLWVLLDLKSVRLTVLALSPAVLGMGGLVAAMGVLGVDFNPLDVLALPVVIGIAVDDGVHLVHRFREERGELARTLRGAGRSVVLTSATSLAAFGSLAVADHRGLASFALVLALGVAAALAVSVVVLPTALDRWGRGALGRI